MHVSDEIRPEEIRAQAAALIDQHALGVWTPNGADRRAAVALFDFLETGRPLSAEQIRSALSPAASVSGANADLLRLLHGTAGLLDAPQAADSRDGRDAVDHVCLLLDALALSRPAAE
ncbi:hypothetical protein FCH28_29365 [Streptomyces piniterrae]|uniref:Uncharacterized protein n=1 Tax=Streptomyces piniterrae TaxID=2571125 RepID=A0A4U0MV73_9ACTN|nr:hypothetical protein [Streptomyces piniterrae]TJZ44462.1 hypothetical protein FCH28_29365 [Streptomyces piniterrae]